MILSNNWKFETLSVTTVGKIDCVYMNIYLHKHISNTSMGDVSAIILL